MQNKEIKTIGILSTAGEKSLFGPVVSSVIVLINSIHEIKNIVKKSNYSFEELLIIYNIIKSNCYAYGLGYGDVKDIENLGLETASSISRFRAINNIILIKENTLFLPRIIKSEHNVYELKDNKNVELQIIEENDLTFYAYLFSEFNRMLILKHFVELVPELRNYNLLENKGNKNKNHIKKILKYGLSSFHRNSICEEILSK